LAYFNQQQHAETAPPTLNIAQRFASLGQFKPVSIHGEGSAKDENCIKPEYHKPASPLVYRWIILVEERACAVLPCLWWNVVTYHCLAATVFLLPGNKVSILNEKRTWLELLALKAVPRP
jgi:hypothetical protein